MEVFQLQLLLSKLIHGYDGFCEALFKLLASLFHVDLGDSSGTGGSEELCGLRCGDFCKTQQAFPSKLHLTTVGRSLKMDGLAVFSIMSEFANWHEPSG
jgi:hypothetical protein